MCAISCRMMSARTSRTVSVTLDRNSICSVIVTQPGFSIAPGLSVTNTWSYLSNG